MEHLVPCPGCERHVRYDEAACPFCRTTLALADTPPPRVPATRLGRAALFAFGASLAAGVVACSSSDDGGEQNAYGAPPMDGGGASGGSGGSSGAAGGAGAGGQTGDGG